MRPPYWELRLHAGHSENPVALGRKFCSGCGRWRQACDFGPHRNGWDGLRARCRACTRAQNREVYARRTDEQRALYREYFRIWAEVKRRRAGIPPRRYNRHTVIDHVERVLLEREPLVRELRAYRGELQALAARARVSERTVSRIMNGESAHVRLDVADKLAVALGVPLATVYHERDAMVLFGEQMVR